MEKDISNNPETSTNTISNEKKNFLSNSLQNIKKVKIALLLKIGLDLFVLSTIGILILIIILIGKTHLNGFYCTDLSIRYPYMKPTINSATLIASGLTIVFLIIIINEIFNVRNRKAISMNKKSSSKLKVYFWLIYRYIWSFLLGCVISHLTVMVFKYSVGRLRPHFIDVCKPDWTRINCESDPYDYIGTQDICTADENSKILYEARHSFLSGYASFSTYSMFFAIIYMHFRLHTSQFISLIRPILQTFCFLFASYICSTRISDYYSHWTDVLMGFINGLLFAFYISICVAGVNKTPKDSYDFGFKDDYFISENKIGDDPENFEKGGPKR